MDNAETLHPEGKGEGPHRHRENFVFKFSLQMKTGIHICT